MCEPSDSSQIKAWLFSPESLALCRARANRVARKLLESTSKSKKKNKEKASDTSTTNAEDNKTDAAQESSADAAATTSPTGDKNGASSTENGSDQQQPPSRMAESFARNFHNQRDKWDDSGATGDDDGPWENKKGHKFVTPEEEQALVSFYVSKLPNLIGPGLRGVPLRQRNRVLFSAAASSPSGTIPRSRRHPW